MPIYYDDIAGTVRAVLATRRSPDDWAAIAPALLRLRDALRAGEEAGIVAGDNALADLVDGRRVDGFGENIDLSNGDTVPPAPGLRELVNSLLSDLGFPEQPTDREPEKGR